MLMFFSPNKLHYSCLSSRQMQAVEELEEWKRRREEELASLSTTLPGKSSAINKRS
jgi:hypothetical protein